MKVFYFLILIFLSAFTIRAQWSNDPNNNLIVGYGLDPHICSDSAGGCYITYDYENIYYPRKLALERLDKYGYKTWGTLKQILGESPQQYRAKIIEDGEGGAIISYIDRYENLPIWTQRVRVQRVDSSGDFLWGQTGIGVTLDTINQGDHHLVTDENGGCVIAWQNVNYTYFINRIDRDGNRLWGNNGTTLNTGGANSQPIVIKTTDGNYYLQAGTIIYRINKNGEILNQFSSTILGQPVSDQEGGVVVSGFTGNIYNRKLVSQRKDTLGNNLWDEPYVEIADSLYINSQLNIKYNQNFYFGWTSNKNSIESQPHIQGLRDDGTELFIIGGIPLSNSSTTITSFISIILSDDLSNVYIWTQWISQPSSSGNFAKRIDTSATLIWGDSAILLNSPALRYLGVTTDCSGGAIGTGYLNEDFAIRVFKISANGRLGEVITSLEDYPEEFPNTETTLYQNYPNPFNSATNIKYQVHREGRIKIVLYNILGEELKILSNEFYTRGTYFLRFNSEELPSGIYFYALESSSEVIVKKLTILK
jgi:hypothetical protein